MEKNVDKVEVKTVDELMAEAELEAMSDKVASKNREPQEYTNETIQEEEENPYEVPLSKEYRFDNGTGEKVYRSLDLSGLVDLTTEDGERFDMILAKLNHNPPNKYKDTTYTKHVAMSVTKLPAEFFNMLNIRDMQHVTAMVYYYFLVG